VNIVLVGMRGSGKSTVGAVLARRLRRPLLDTDEMAVQQAGLAISEIVFRSGWERFRDIEAEAVREAALGFNTVIVTGGGVVLHPENVKRLRNTGVLVLLEAGIDELARRVGAGAGRPPLHEGMSVREDLEAAQAERQPLYQKAADIKVNTEGRSPETVAADIAGRLLARGHDIVPPETGICAVVGYPLEHSLSPALHNAAYDALGLDFIYVAYPARRVSAALDRLKALGARGVSVTIPFKQTVLAHLDELDGSARETGAVNTVVNADGYLTGYNTDAGAAVKALEEKMALRGKKALVIGAGGAAAAIAAGLKKNGAAVTILARRPAQARRLGKRVGASGSGLDELDIKTADILVNATPVGMWPDVDKAVVSGERLRRGQVVFDAVYNPRRTRLLREAEAVGATVVYGERMFLHQAAAQFALFTGREAPLPVMEKTLRMELGG